MFLMWSGSRSPRRHRQRHFADHFGRIVESCIGHSGTLELGRQAPCRGFILAVIVMPCVIAFIVS